MKNTGNCRSSSPALNGAPYDFRRCKLCKKRTAAPLYTLTTTTVYGCQDCDFHFIDSLDDLSPFPEEGAHEIDQQSWDYIEMGLGGNGPRASRRLSLVQQFADLSKAICIDIGAGAGDFSALLAAEGASVFGVEPSRIRRQFARRRFGLELLGQTAEEICGREEFADHFDIVTIWDVIEHVNFPAETLAAAARILKPGGTLFLDTPSRDTLSYRFSESAYRLSSGRAPLFLSTFYSHLPYGHKQIFKPRQLAHLAHECGLDVIKIGRGYESGAKRFSSFRPRNNIVLVCRRPKMT